MVTRVLFSHSVIGTKVIIQIFLARNFVPQSVGRHRSLFGCLCRPLYDEQLTRDTERTVLSVAMQKYSYEQVLRSAGHSV